MNKTAIKNYAVWARVQLIEAVKQRAFEYEITESGEYNANLDSINGRVLSAEEKEQRSRLIELIKQKGYEQVMEEAAYTWFNRFIALRFMEVNGYLPSKTRVFTDESNSFKPEILKQAMTVELDGLDREKVLDLIENQKNEELYKYLLITQCNALNSALPEMFEKIGGWTELLFPSNLLKTDSVLERMIKEIPEDNWTDQVEIIGWLYQYYNDERKNQVINIQKSIVKKEDIPAATQLFTTDWVVRYIVDNSLGRYWIERNAESTLAEKLDYFVLPKNGQITYIDEKVDPQDIKVLDPCMGSAHFLVYAFDVLMAIYEEMGYSQKDAAVLIAEKNLYGLEIDKRAFQLAYFALIMKVRSYNRKVLRRKNKVNLNIAYIKPTDYNTDFVSLYSESIRPVVSKMLEEFKHGDELGSIIQLSVTTDELSSIKTETETILNNYYDNFFDSVRQSMVRTDFVYVLKQAEIMIGKYDVVATNPPFMNKMDKDLRKYVNDKYKDYSGDLFSVFIYRNFDFCKPNGYSGFMSPYVWMFIKTYEKLRNFILTYKFLTTLVQMEYSAFEEATVPICTFVLKNARSDDKGLYFRLTDFKGGMKVQNEKVLEAIANPYCGYLYEANSDNFSKIPGSPIAYWVSDAFFGIYNNSVIGDCYKTITGSSTSDNGQFLRLWFEVDIDKVGMSIQSDYDGYGYKWIKCNKGGSFRKWGGNQEYLINWDNDGMELKQFAVYKNHGGHWSRFLKSLNMFYKDGITWSKITSGDFSARYMPEGFIMESAACAIMPSKDDTNYLLGLMNSKVAQAILKVLNPTINMQVGDVVRLPIANNEALVPQVDRFVSNNINISNEDWNSFETSWDFKTHPLAVSSLFVLGDGLENKYCIKLSDAFRAWAQECNERFNQLKANEEELNRIFIEIYGLQDELTPEVEDRDVTVRKADLQREIKSLISYAVGCMFGRYSVNVEGLQFAGGDWTTWYDANRQMLTANGYTIDPDNIIPICDDDYFDDDIVGLFVDFVREVYGEDTLEANLQFIADALGGKGTSREVIRKYFLNDFYKDHCKIYQKRPIYWLFSSGKKNGFKALIYLHRYQPDQLARMRTDYVHEQQERYRTQLQMSEESLSSAAPSEKVKLNKRIAKLKDQALELQKYEEKIHHLADQMIPLDLDDGVKVNYAKFGDVLEKIK